jgi:hypothetical protein
VRPGAALAVLLRVAALAVPLPGAEQAVPRLAAAPAVPRVLPERVVLRAPPERLSALPSFSAARLGQARRTARRPTEAALPISLSVSSWSILQGMRTHGPSFNE